MTAPVRPSLDSIVQSVDRPPLDQIVAAADAGPSSLDQLHADYASGALQRRTRLANIVDQGNAADADALAASERAGKALGVAAAPLSEVPGGTALEAGIGRLAGAPSYQAALGDVDSSIASAPAAARIPAKMLGAGVSAAFMPGSSAAAQAAQYGFLDALAQANPDVDVRHRIGEGIVDAAIAAPVGKATEYLGTGLRGLRTADPATQRVALSAARSAAAAPGYTAFRQLGDLEPHGGPLNSLLDLPVISRAIKTVKDESPTLQGLPDSDAQVLDAVYKRVGKKAFAAANGYETNEARAALLDQIEAAAQDVGGTYKAPVDAYRQGSQLMEANRLGSRVLKNTVTGTPESQETTASPAAFQQWLQSASPGEIAQANQGIAGRLGTPKVPLFGRIPLTRIPLPVPGKGLRAAIPLLAQTGTPATLLGLMRSLRATP